MVARIIRTVGLSFRPFRLGGIIRSCIPQPWGMIGSFESELIGTICGFGEATDEIVTIFFAGVPNSSVEFKLSGVFFLNGFSSPDDCSAWKTSESLELKELIMIIFQENGKFMTNNDFNRITWTGDGRSSESTGLFSSGLSNFRGKG